MSKKKLGGASLLGAGAATAVALLALGSRERKRVKPDRSFRAGPRVASYWREVGGQNVKCELCFRNCVIPPGKRGFCGVRENKRGELYTLVYGLPCALQIDPIEKEPLLHVLPGSRIFCMSTVGCSQRCFFCHNWHISQALPEEVPKVPLPPSEAVKIAQRRRCVGVSFTYVEPTVFFEYMLDVAKEFKAAKMRAFLHTCGAINLEPLSVLLRYLDAVVVDLKAFTDEFFRRAAPGGNLSHVLSVLKAIKQAGVWLEVVNLVIPGYNDDLRDIEKMCLWIKKNLSPEVPLHFSRFFPEHKMRHVPPTPIRTLEAAREVALSVGLRFVSIGNVPGHPANSTHCPKCGKVVIKRHHFAVLDVNLRKGKCKFCDRPIPGIWA